MLRRLCGNSHDAEDVFQDTAVRVWRGLRARRHAARCPRCAESSDFLRGLEESLGSEEPLTSAQRSLWIQAIGEPRPRSFPRLRLVVLPAAAILLGIALVAAWRMSHPT